MRVYVYIYTVVNQHGEIEHQEIFSHHPTFEIPSNGYVRLAYVDGGDSIEVGSEGE